MVAPARWIAAFALMLLVAPVAQASSVCAPADCLPIVPFPNVPYLQGKVDFRSFAADVTVRDAIAVTHLELVVANAGANATQATVAMPLPDGAAILAFNLTIGEHVIHGRVQERGQAQAEYQEAVEAGRDAALLQQADKRQVVLQLNVGPGEQRILKAAYAESLPLAGGARIYRLPLSQLQPLPDQIHLGLDIASRLGAQNVSVHGWSIPLTNGVGTVDLAPTQASDLIVTWTEEAGRRSSLVAASDFGSTAMLATLCLDGAVLARDVAFIIDQSGSMRGLKMEEARQALVGALGTLTPADQFTVVPFSNDAVPFRSKLVAATTSTIQTDQAKAAKLDIEGGTNLDSSLQEAFRQLAAAPTSNRLPMVVLLTDGLPTVGITDHEQIIDRARAANTREAPIVVVPIGLDADYTFLATLALRSGGAYVDPGTPDALLSDRLDRLSQVLAGPVTAGGVLTIAEAEAGSVYPRTLPPVYLEDCLEVRFRSTTSGPINISYVARGASGVVTYSKTFQPSDITQAPAVENLWAQWLVQELLAQERTDAQADLRAAIIANATRYGLLTPYTAWVLTDDAPPSPSGHMDAVGAASGSTASSTSTSYYGTGTGSGTGAGGGASSQYDKATKTPGPAFVLVAIGLLAIALLRRRQG